MTWLSDIAAWIAAHETFLSGLAALVAVATVVLTPIGLALRRGRRDDRAPAAPGPPAEAPKAALLPGRPSLAVLPFANLSEDREQEFLADGMTEDLITGLSANRHLSVVSRNSTFAYKGRSPDIRDVGRELGVRYVLEGSVRRVGDHMRTTAQLIDSATGEHLWAEKYDRPYAEMFDVQDEVVASLAGALNAQLGDAEFRRASREKPKDLGAWELVQRAFGGIFNRSPTVERLAENERLIRAALELDPEYAYARATLAWTLLARAINGFAADLPDTLAEARRALEEALEYDSDDPLTLFYLGGALLYAGRFERARRTLERSLERNPHQPDAYMHQGLVLGYLTRFEEAHALFDRAEALAPTGGLSLAYGWYRNFVLCFEERYEEAIEQTAAFLERVPRYAAARAMYGLALDAVGRSDEARRAMARAARDNPGLNVDGLALLIGAHPDPEKGAARAARMRELWPAEAS